MKPSRPTRRHRIEPVLQVELRSKIGQLRAVPVRLGAGAGRAFLTVHGADYDVDPWVEMFFFPTDTLKMTLVTDKGEILWRKDLGRGVVPGMWFCPVFPFDLDGDGVDEIWYVGNPDHEHPLGISRYQIECLDARTGKTMGEWPWPRKGGDQSLSHTFRNFIAGGRVGRTADSPGEPVLVTAQGTYGDMFLQGWRPGMAPRWEHRVAKEAPGARGSHMCPVADLDGDGTDEILWGERCIELGAGAEVFCADRDSYRGHSDVVQPILDRESGRWFIYTCRESDGQVAPRVALFDRKGNRVWGKVERGHIDMGWGARIGDEGRHVATAIRISSKGSGPGGHTHKDREEFAFDALSGEEVALPFSSYCTTPVDLDGDGFHELVYGKYKGEGRVIDRHGKEIGSVGGRVAMASKLLDLPGEQVLQHEPGGTVRVWADLCAEDSPPALARYAHPFYEGNRRLTCSGSNINALAGV